MVDKSPSPAVEVLGPHANFEQVPFGKATIDVFTINDMGRTTVDQTMNKAEACIAAHSQAAPYFVLFNQTGAKSALLMTPYAKSRVEKAYGNAKCKLYAAVIVNDGFLDLDSKAFLAKQEVVKTGMNVTQFFTSFEDGLNWLKAMVEEENLHH